MKSIECISIRKIRNLCVKWLDFEKVNFSFFCINISIFLCQDYWKIKSSSKHENKIDIAKDIKYISLKNKSFTKKILSIKNNEFLKIDFPNEKGELELFSLKETKTLSKKIQKNILI